MAKTTDREILSDTHMWGVDHRLVGVPCTYGFRLAIPYGVSQTTADSMILMTVDRDGEPLIIYGVHPDELVPLPIHTIESRCVAHKVLAAVAAFTRGSIPVLSKESAESLRADTTRATLPPPGAPGSTPGM